MQPDQTTHNTSIRVLNWTDETVPTQGGAVAVRVYRGNPAPRPTPVVLHLHGGAFVAGGIESGGTVARLLAEAGAIVASIDYPLAPQHPFPQALDAAFDVLKFIASGRAAWAGKKAPLYVAGEEAGGNLAAALALMARDQRSPLLTGQILLSPMLDPSMATCSVREANAGPSGCQWADGWNRYLGSPDRAAHPYAAPIGSSRLAGVAPALLVTAEDDLLRDETLSYVRRLQGSGVRVQQHVLAGPTGWPCALHAGDGPTAWTDQLRAPLTSFFADTVARPTSNAFHHHVA